jgi:putative transposase
MTNHVHLLLTPPDDVACALLMRDLGRCYAAYFNRRYEEWGTPWERPFRSCLVDSAAYVLRCYRYIERNPVRAGMIPSPSAFAWSSYAGNSGAREDSLLTPHSEYVAIAIDVSGRQVAYRQLLDEPDDDHFVQTMRKATDGGFALIGDELKSQLQAAGARLQSGKPGPRAPAESGAASDETQLSFFSD